MAGLTYVRMIDAWRASGYTVKLMFLALDAGLRNFQNVYRHRVDFWQWFDNGGETPILLEEGRRP